ncbi:sodium:calcium antiporter [Candidatus Woesearchaeota archaeon]|nr:sodium:calcium antiporter [Candidatus Woesearchaeota archaeon]
MLLQDMLLFAVSLFFLSKSADWLIKSLTGITSRAREFAIGALIVGIGTSLPELFVGVSSAFSKAEVISLGNVIGSNIVDMGLILGILVLINRGISLGKVVVKDEMVAMLFAACVPIFLLLDSKLSRVDGVLLVVVFIFYTWGVLKRHKVSEVRNGVSFAKSIAVSAFSLLILLVSSDLVVKSGLSLAGDLGLPALVIGLVAVAFGTSVPELIFTLKSREGIALGNLVGSVVVNSSLVLGVTAIISPFTVNFRLFAVSATFMLVILSWSLMMAEKKNRLSVRDGVLLVIAYILFVAAEMLVGQQIL